MRELRNGLDKLAHALGVFDISSSGKILNKSSIFLEEPAEPVNKNQIIVGPRIGIRQAVDHPARFSIKNNIFVSKP